MEFALVPCAATSSNLSPCPHVVAARKLDIASVSVRKLIGRRINLSVERLLGGSGRQPVTQSKKKRTVLPFYLFYSPSDVDLKFII